MVKFCRSCGKELADHNARTCNNCGASSIKSTAYCRYCGHATRVDDTTCGNCGASIKPLPSSTRSLFEYPRLSARMGRIVNLTIVVLLITTYVVLALPKSIKRPIQAKAADAVFETTGYTAYPLTGLSTYPITIPKINVAAGNIFFFRVGDTEQITAYGIYKNTDPATNNATKSVKMEDVTANSTFMSTNPAAATVDAKGLVTAVSIGKADIIVTYSAAPGSANMSSAAIAAGKVPVTFTADIPVTVIAALHN